MIAMFENGVNNLFYFFCMKKRWFSLSRI